MREIAKSYPELLDGRVIPALTELGLRIGASLDMATTCIAGDMLTLIARVEEALDKEEVREAVGSATGQKPPNPRRDYVEECVRTLKKEDEVALRLLRISSRMGYTANFDEMIQKAKEEFGIELDKKEIYEHLRKLDDMGLLEELSQTSTRVKDQYKKHVIDLAEI